jgi:hypothetical protein
LLRIRIGDNELDMLVDDRDTPASGEAIEVAFAPEGVRLFDGASGKAIVPGIASR